MVAISDRGLEFFGVRGAEGVDASEEVGLGLVGVWGGVVLLMLVDVGSGVK